jgi:hypothetical protein
MVQATWVANKDARIANGPNGNVGAGASVSMPFGTYSGYEYRTLLGFSYSFSGVTAINSAVLWVRMSNQNYVAFGSSPSCYVDLITGTWSEGSSSSLSSSNSVIYPGPTSSSTNRASKNTGSTENAWVSITVTSMLRQALANGVFNGLRLIAQSTSAADVGEIWAREQGTSYRAYLVVDYSTNTVPSAPTLQSPVGGVVVDDATPDLKFTPIDAQGDASSSVRYQVSKQDNFIVTIEDVTTPGTFPSGVQVTQTIQTPLDRGFTYYWRAASTDATGAGPFSAAQSFKYNALPSVEPAGLPYGGANHVAPIHNLNQSATPLNAKPQFTFTPTAANAINAYEVEVSGYGSDTVAGSFQSGVAIVHKFSLGVTNLTPLTVRFRVSTAAEGYGPWSNPTTFAVKYAEAAYERSMAGATGITVSTSGVVGSSQLLYRQAAGAGGAGAGVWTTSVPATVDAYLNILVRTASSGTAPAQPKVGTLKLLYISATLLPYSWTFDGGNWTLDQNVRRYGTKSLSLTPVGAVWKNARQSISGLAPNTDYSYSVWLLVQSHVAGRVGITVHSPPGNPITQADIARNTVGWERLTGTFRTADGVTSVEVILFGTPDLLAPTTVNFDAAMLSEGTVAPVWTPALVGAPVVMDAQGIFIDGAANGLLRVAGPTSATNDVVEIGGASSGIKFGGGPTLSNPGDGNLLSSHGVFSPFAVNGFYGNVMFIPSDGTTNGKWGKLASGSIAADYSMQSMQGIIASRYNIAEFSLIIGTDATAAGEAYPVLLSQRNLTSFAGPLNFMVITEGTAPVRWSLWFQIPNEWAGAVWMPTMGSAIGGAYLPPTIHNPADTGWVDDASLPAGVRYPASGGGGTTPITRVLTGSGNWTKPAGLSYIDVTVVGGGAGGASANTSSAGNSSFGSGGGAGGVAHKRFSAADLAGAADFAYVAGTGSGGSTSPAAGGTSSFSGVGITTVQATGGGPGVNGASGSTSLRRSGGAGGIGSGGDVNISGGPGGNGSRDTGLSEGGPGGSNAYGGGGSGETSGTASDQNPGDPGRGYGAGGSGAMSQGGGTSAVGGGGSTGVVIVTEYY